MRGRFGPARLRPGVRLATVSVVVALVLSGCGGGGSSQSGGSQSDSESDRVAAKAEAREDMCRSFDLLLAEYSQQQENPLEADYDALGDAIDSFETAVARYDRVESAPGVVAAADQLPLDLAAGGGDGLDALLLVCEEYFDRQAGLG